MSASSYSDSSRVVGLHEERIIRVVDALEGPPGEWRTALILGRAGEGCLNRVISTVRPSLTLLTYSSLFDGTTYSQETFVFFIFFNVFYFGITIVKNS